MMKFRLFVPVFLIAVVGIAPRAEASGFVASLPDVPIEPIPETMQTSPDDYPPESRRAGQEGVVKLAITVSPDGRVIACSIYRSSGVRALDERSCVLATERFRFRPARRDGIAVEDKAILPIDWRLDPADPPSPALTNPPAREVAPRLTRR